MIPKIIHLCWLGSAPHSGPIQKCIDSIKEILDGYEIKVWTQENFNVTSVQWVKEAFDMKKYAFAVDYMRFWILYHYGGIYLDSDVEVLRKFDGMLADKSFIGFEYLNIPESAVIGAEKGTGWIKECMEWYEDKSFFDSIGQMRMDIVPLLIKNVLEREYRCRLFDCNEIKVLDGLTLYPYFYFSPKNYFTGKIESTKETVCIHRFAATWGPQKKRRWTLVVHSIVIKLMGKRLHDRIFRIVKPLPKKFNGEEL